MTFEVQAVGKYERPATLFHLTASDNIQSIRIEGLVPGKHRRGILVGTDIRERRREYVWLTDDVDYILYTQAGPDWIRRSAAVFLSISTDNLDLRRVLYPFRDNALTSPHEWVVSASIPPRNILSVSSVINHHKYREDLCPNYPDMYAPLDRPPMNSIVYGD